MEVDYLMGYDMVTEWMGNGAQPIIGGSIMQIALVQSLITGRWGYCDALEIHDVRALQMDDDDTNFASSVDAYIWASEDPELLPHAFVTLPA